MSNVYSSEPPTTGKVILVTNYGNIDIELWTKEAPRTCRNFIQLCLENYYNNCIFHRIIKDFMIQTGDPGDGGSSIWGKEFGDEFHSRLRFNHRGIVAMANKNIANTNGSQFFITMDKCQWLDKKHTIFGKVVGDTYFNAHSIADIPTRDDYPVVDMIPKIIRTEVVINPFVDIIPRNVNNEQQFYVKVEPKKVKDVKNLQNSNLLSFEDDFDNGSKITIKALHEVSKNDKKLVNRPVVIVKNTSKFDDNTHQSIINKITAEKINKAIKPRLIPNQEDAASSEEDQNDILIKQVETTKPKSLMNTELLTLQREIAIIKRRSQKIEEHNLDEEEDNKLTPLQKLNQEYIANKRGRAPEIETISKLNKFKDKLKQKNENSWMTNKLKFHVDSQKAYNINDMKEKQAKSYDTINK